LKEKLLREMKNIKEKNKLDLFFFAGVDIIKINSILFIAGECEKELAVLS